ncbi:MAG: hypothetical protein ACM3S5_01690, partial [Rhodospirillales bacterium]
MLPFILLTFLLMFALVVLAVSLGLKFLETQKKKKVAEMLDTATAGPAVIETKVLLEPEKPANVAIQNLLRRFDFVRKMEAHIQQAGMTMNVYSLLLLMVGLLVPGALLGARLNILMYPEPSALAGALVCGSLPYLYVLGARKKRLATFEEQFPEALDFL